MAYLSRRDAPLRSRLGENEADEVRAYFITLDKMRVRRQVAELMEAVEHVSRRITFDVAESYGFVSLSFEIIQLCECRREVAAGNARAWTDSCVELNRVRSQA